MAYAGRREILKATAAVVTAMVGGWPVPARRDSQAGPIHLTQNFIFYA